MNGCEEQTGSRGGGTEACLTWEDLSVETFGYGTKAFDGKKLIEGITGYAVPGRVLAIMGPSGSGKSTLLDSLAGRLAHNKVLTGTILLNGEKAKLGYGGVAYVTQEDTLLGTLTVRETINYSAHIRLPTALSSFTTSDIVERTIAEMGLIECADCAVGNWHIRGISGGERKRLSIALEVLTRPAILFLDEPTTGLDSAAAFFVATILGQMAREAGMTVVASVHQPSGQVFAVFDDLCLLSGGDMVYFGDSNMAVEFFQGAGFACPVRRNPSDHFLFCINTDFDQVNNKLSRSRRHRLQEDDLWSNGNNEIESPTLAMETSAIKARLVDFYRTSAQAAETRRTIQSMADKYGSTTPVSLPTNSHDSAGNLSKATWWRQLTTLTRRSFTNMFRDAGYFWLRAAVYVICSVCVGTVFFNVGTDYSSILARTSVAGFVFGYMSVMAIGGFPSVIEETKVFFREYRNGHYDVMVYVVSSLISSIPFITAIALCSSSITYFLVKLHPGWSHFLFFFANLFGCISVVESVMMMVAAIVPNFLMGIAAGTGIMGVMLLSAGFLRMMPDMPKPFWRYPSAYLSFGSWALQGQYKNDLLGLDFQPLMPGSPKLAGEHVIETVYGVSLEHSKWLDLASIYFLIVFYRLIAFFVLKFRERTSNLFRSTYACGGRFGLIKRRSATAEVSVGVDADYGAISYRK